MGLGGMFRAGGVVADAPLLLATTRSLCVRSMIGVRTGAAQGRA